MSIRALRTFLAVQQHGSFRAAAEIEGLTPSAVSHQMKNLEQLWEVKLFDRSLRTPTLTEIGTALVEDAKSVVDAYDNLPSKARSGDAMMGELTLGAVPTTLTGLIPAGLSRLKGMYPDLRARIVPGLTNELLRQLERSQIDAAFISRPEVLPEAFNFEEITSEELVLLVPQDCEDLPPIDLLRTFPFIRFTRDAVVGRQIEAWLQKNNIQVAEVMELEGLDAISSMVAARLGVSVVPDSWSQVNQLSTVKKLKLEANGPKRVLGVVSRSTSRRSSAVSAVKEALLEAVRDGS